MVALDAGITKIEFKVNISNFIEIGKTAMQK